MQSKMNAAIRRKHQKKDRERLFEAMKRAVEDTLAGRLANAENPGIYMRADIDTILKRPFQR